MTQAASAYTRTLEGAKQLPSINRKSMHNNVQERDEREIKVGKEVERDLCHQSLSGKGKLMYQDSNPCFPHKLVEGLVWIVDVKKYPGHK